MNCRKKLVSEFKNDFFCSVDNSSANNTDPLSTTSQTQSSEEGNTGTTKRSFAESNENSEESNVGNPVSTAGGDDESRRKKRKDETGKEGKSTTQRNTGLFFRLVDF